MIRRLIVDDHQLVRQGLCALLMKAQDIEIVGEARDGQEALELAQLVQPDVILMDIEMPRLNGLRATAQLAAARNRARVLVLSMRDDEKDVRAAVEAGAIGYLVKNSSREELIQAIRSVYQGHPVYSPSVTGFLAPQKQQANPAKSGYPLLT